MTANAHLARLQMGQHARGKAALESMLLEAMALLTLAAESSGWDAEAADAWATRYLALAERYDGTQS